MKPSKYSTLLYLLYAIWRGPPRTTGVSEELKINKILMEGKVLAEKDVETQEERGTDQLKDVEK